MMENIDTKIILLSCIGMFITLLNFGNLNVVLPPLQQLFHTTTATISWTVSIYVLLLSCTILLFGKLSDKHGKVRIYGHGFIVFFVGSLICALSPNVGTLIAARAIQGIGAAMIQANAVALITAMLPEHKRVQALSLLGLAMGLGPILGPALGGAIVSFASWRLIFLINLPICIWGWYESRKIKDSLHLLKAHPLPVLQLLLFSLAILCFLFSLSKVASNHALASILIIIAVILAGSYIIIEKRRDINILPLTLFKQVYFTIPLLGIMVFGLCSAVIFILPPFMFENYLHYQPWLVGIIGLVCPAGFLIGSQLIPFINKHLSMEQSTLWGLIFMLISFVGLWLAQMTMLLPLYYLMLFIYGFAGAVFQIVALNIIMQYQEIQLHGTIGAIIRMFQNMTVAIGTTMTALFIQYLNVGNSTYGYTLTFAVAAIFVLFMTLLQALKLNKRKKIMTQIIS